MLGGEEMSSLPSSVAEETSPEQHLISRSSINKDFGIPSEEDHSGRPSAERATRTGIDGSRPPASDHWQSGCWPTGLVLTGRPQVEGGIASVSPTGRPLVKSGTRPASSTGDRTAELRVPIRVPAGGIGRPSRAAVRESMIAASRE